MSIIKAFVRVWRDAKTTPPKESGRYWCMVEELSDLGFSKFQWNCAYNEQQKTWSDGKDFFNVTHWTQLAPTPK